jgi:hypothetical protein
MVAGADRFFSKDDNRNDTLVELKTRVEYLASSVNKLTEQPYVRREEYRAGLEAVENRVTGLEGRLGQLEQRASRDRSR